MVQGPAIDTSLQAEPRPASPYQGESKSIFIVFLELFFSRWMLICGIFFSASLWSYLTLARAPDTYEANAQILIRRGKIQAIQDVPILRQQEEVGSEVDILLSIAVIDEAVDQLLSRARASGVTDSADPNARQPRKIFGLYDPSRPYNVLKLSDLPVTDPAALRKLLKGQINIRKFGESNVIEVAVVAVNPVYAAEAVNTVLDVYEKFNIQVEKVPGQANFYENEMMRLDDEINALQARLAAYKQEHVVGGAEQERELVTLRRYNSQLELDKLQRDKVALEADLRVVGDPASRMEAGFLRNDQAIVRLRVDIFDRQSQIAELRSRSTQDNPLVKAKQEELQELERNLEREVELAIAQQRHLYRQTLDRERELQGKIAQLDAQLMTYPVLEAEIDRLDRDIKQRTTKRLGVVDQMVRSSALENPGESLNKVKILGYSQVPPIPREARKGFKLMVAVALSGIAAFVAAVFVEGLDHSIRRRDEIEEQLRVPYLASLSSHLR